MKYKALVIEASGVPVTGLTDANIKFRISPYGAGNVLTISVLEVGSYGNYICGPFTTFQDVKLFINSVEQTWFGISESGDITTAVVNLTGNQTIAGVKTFSSTPKSSAAATATTELIRWDEAVRTSGNQTGMSGNKGWLGIHTYTDNRPILAFTESYVAPSDNLHLTDKYYVDTEIAAITPNAYQESVNKVRVIVEGTQVTNQVYKTILTGVNSFSTCNESNKNQVEIAGCGAAFKYITAAVGSLKSYVNLAAVGKHIWVYFLDLVKTATVILENMTVLFGEGSGNGARTYNGLTFENCIVYHYHSLTLTNCTVRNCLFLGSSSYAVTLDGSTTVINSQFNNPLVDGGSWTGEKVNVTDTFAMDPPTDPTVPT